MFRRPWRTACFLVIYDLQESDDGFKPKARHHSFEIVQYVLYTASLKSSFLLCDKLYICYL